MKMDIPMPSAGPLCVGVCGLHLFVADVSHCMSSGAWHAAGVTAQAGSAMLGAGQAGLPMLTQVSRGPSLLLLSSASLQSAYLITLQGRQQPLHHEMCVCRSCPPCSSWRTTTLPAWPPSLSCRAFSGSAWHAKGSHTAAAQAPRTGCTCSTTVSICRCETVLSHLLGSQSPQHVPTQTMHAAQVEAMQAWTALRMTRSARRGPLPRQASSERSSPALCRCCGRGARGSWHSQTPHPRRAGMR